jgi:ABC-type multidrug transport system ATPase subunit
MDEKSEPVKADSSFERSRVRTAKSHQSGDNVVERNDQLVDIRVRNVSVRVDPGAGSPFSSIDAFKARILRSKTKAPIKDILKDLSADLPSRSLTAIVGASGSGKTTLLNIIARRIKDPKFQQFGNVAYESSTSSSPSDQDKSRGLLSARIGVAYVVQQDVLLPTLTVRETLQYAADLRLSTTKTKAERQTMVESVIEELGLDKCANTRIGNNAHQGCSGGEKRRTSIGIQLLADQPVLILDEPTTGLDAASAILVVRTLKKLAERGKTVIMTSKSFSSFFLLIHVHGPPTTFQLTDTSQPQSTNRDRKYGD